MERNKMSFERETFPWREIMESITRVPHEGAESNKKDNDLNGNFKINSGMRTNLY